MSSNTLVSIQPVRQGLRDRRVDGKIMLVKPPYFTPWTPPLGIAILKSFLEQNDFSAQCFDFNIDPDLWGMHHKYFTALQKLEDVSINDGYSKLWWILNAHMLAYANGADAATCAYALERVIPQYGIRCDRPTINALIPLVEKFFQKLEELTDRIDLSDFAMVGTSTYTTSLAASLFILKRVKRKYPRILTVMGGGIFADDLALGSENLDTLVEKYPYVDHVILGEGEMLLLKLLEGELAHRRVISIADLKGKTLEMKDVPVPDFSDLQRDIYYHLTIEGARSCPFQCSFCSETIQWGDYRKKPTEIFVDQVLDLAVKYDNNAFFMGDSLMNPYINSFASELIKRKASIVYDGYLRADKPVTNRRFVKLWADSGLYRVRLGIESAAARVLDSMDKMTTPQVISDVLKTLAAMGIRTTTYWIVGFPGETEQDFQETCDFISEHHQFIYELEAHPYYYYPYGQIGSRLYQCHSLYPDDVTDVIKFKVWDINDSDPPRDVRYDRLRRISKLAADLGLPNIYTMTERYEAEKRWHSLHPLAAEVYEKTRRSRDKARPSTLALKLGTRTSQTTHAPAAPGTSSVLCYLIMVAKKLDERALRAAVEHLVDYNEMLQVGLKDGAYVAMAGDIELPGAELLATFHHAENDGEAGFDASRLVEKLSAGMLPARGYSLRVACVAHDDAATEIFVLAHRAIADAWSVALLCEDLFRAYEQLANGQAVSLRPVPKTFVEFVETGSADFNGLEIFAARNHVKDDGVNTIETTLRLDGDLVRKLVRGMFREADVRPVDLLISAVLKSLAGEAATVDVLANHRAFDDTLARTVAPLNRIVTVPTAFLKEGCSLAVGKGSGHVLETIFSNGEKAAAGAVPSNDETPHARVLFNLEYVINEPWLGGDEWRPQGFVPGASDRRDGYDLEIVPLVSQEAVEVRLRCGDEPRARKLVEDLSASLGSVVDSMLRRCEEYVAAKRFWLSEFGNNVPKSNVEIDGNAHASANAEMATQSCAVEAASMQRLCAESGAGETVVALAAFALLLSRLNGRQDVVIASCFDDCDGAPRRVLPLRLYPSWGISFREFVRETGRKILEASNHSGSALEILSDERLLTREEVSRVTLDVGFIYDASRAARSVASATEVCLKSFEPTGKSMSLMLVGAHDDNDAPMFHVVYDAKSFNRDAIEKSCSYLRTIFDAVAANVDLTLGDVPLEEARKSRTAAETVVADVFSFE